MTPDQIKTQLYACRQELKKLASDYIVATDKIEREMLTIIKQCPHPEDRLVFCSAPYDSGWVCEICGKEFRKNPHKEI